MLTWFRKTHRDGDEEDDNDETRMPGHFDTVLAPQPSPSQVPVPGTHPSFVGRGFRIGFAGRGMMRGGPHQRGS